MKISHFISESFETFSSTEKKIADRILNNKQHVIHSNIHEFSKLCGVSTSSIVRFSKLVGAQGFQDLKVCLAQEGEESPIIDITQGIQKGDTVSEISQKSIATNIDVLKMTYNILDFSVIADVVSILKKAHRIYIIGIGGSSLIAQDFQYKLIRIRKDCFHIQDSHTQMILGKSITKNDAVIAISYSGETKEILKTVLTSQTENKISITKLFPNSIEKECNLNLYVPNCEGYFRLGAMTSRISTLALLDILYLAMITDDIEDVKNHIIETREILK